MKNKNLKTFLIWVTGMSLAILFGCLVPFLRCDKVQGEIYAPDDSLWLEIGTVDTTLLTVADADSIRIRWYAPDGTKIDSTKLTSSVLTGFFQTKIRAGDGSNNEGAYSAFAVAYKDGKSGVKTWSWVVKKAEFDSLTTILNARLDATVSSRSTLSKGDVADTTYKKFTDGSNEDQFKADVSNLDVAVSTRSTLTKGEVADTTYKKFTDGTNEDEFKADVSNLDEPISGIDDNPWDNTEDTTTGMGLWFANWWHDIDDDSGAGGGGSCPTANENASAVWSYSDDITLTDTVPKVYAVNASGSDPDTLANRVWTWSTRTLTSGAGTGTYQVEVITKQSSDSSEIVSAVVQVLNSTQTSTVGLLSTGSNGDAIFSLDSDTFMIRMYKPGWQFSVPETAVVSSDTTIIFYADMFDPGSPPSADLCRVYGWIKDINNLPVVGAKVEAKVNTIPLRFGSVVISPYYKVTTTDGDGYWYLDLYPNVDLTPDDTKYQFFIYSPSGTILRVKAVVPEQSSWELSF